MYLRLVSNKQSVHIPGYNLPFLLRASNVSFVSKHLLCDSVKYKGSVGAETDNEQTVCCTPLVLRTGHNVT
jgi:hypothetical protein